MPQQGTEAQKPQYWEQHQQADLPVGEILRRTRQHYRLSLDDVEIALRIRASQLGAIEQGRLDMPPGRVYAIGFVRAYGEYLGLDGDQIVTLFKRQLTGGHQRPELSLPVPASESKVPNFYVIGGSLAALVVVLGFSLMIGGKNDTPAVADVPAELRAATDIPLPEDIIQAEAELSAMEAAAIEPASGDAAAEAVPEEPGYKTIISVSDSVWIEIRNKEGKAILSRIMKPGDEYTLPAEEGLVMDTGNAGAIDIKINDTAIPKLGDKGDVKRKIALDPEALFAAAKESAAKAAAVAKVAEEPGEEVPVRIIP